MNCDFLIVGAGISGMNLALKIKRNFKNKKILLVDSSNIFGGRIQTIYEHNYEFESGAARFNDNHKNLLDIINRYKLQDLKTEIPSSWQVKYLGRKYSSKFKNVDTLINNILKKYTKINKKTKKYLISKNLYEVCEDLYGKKEAEFLSNSHPYYSELFILNAYDSINAFNNDLNEDLKFYILKGGLSQITNSLFIESKYSNIKFKFNTILNRSIYDEKENIFKSYFTDIDDNEVIIESKNLIYAIDGKGFKKLNLDTFDKYITEKKLTFKMLQDSIDVQPLLRTYVKFKRGKDELWVDKIKKTVTNDKLKFVVPIGNGVVMVSYTDGRFAKYWNNKMTTFTQKELIYKTLRKLFPNEKISDHPLFFKNYYWPQGASYWKKNIDSDKLAPIFQKPTSLKFYICGDSYSQRQAWIEGALESSNDVYEKIILDNIE
jgi:hypothetical protein